MNPIKFKLVEYRDSSEWKRFKNTYVTKIRKESEVERVEAFLDGVIQGICVVTPECEKAHYYCEECHGMFGNLCVGVYPSGDDCWLDEIMVEVTLDDEEDM